LPKYQLERQYGRSKRNLNVPVVFFLPPRILRWRQEKTRGECVQVFTGTGVKVMDESAVSQTRSSLLERLRQNPEDQAAWNEFVARYGPKIHSWCRFRQLQEADAHDVTQTVLMQLATKMRRFVYDPSRSFRGWLRTLTHHAWSDFVADRQRTRAAAADTRSLDALLTLAAGQDLETHLEEAFDLELMELATARVRERVEHATWEAFRLTALESLSGAETARQLGMQVAAVFKAKSNVKKLLQDEIKRLEQAEG
jgi:RNA polymerase sigma-70 factor (ECF subfamily)